MRPGTRRSPDHILLCLRDTRVVLASDTITFEREREPPMRRLYLSAGCSTNSQDNHAGTIVSAIASAVRRNGPMCSCRPAAAMSCCTGNA